MTVESFKLELLKLNEEIRAAYSDFENEVFPIEDGPLDADAYFNNDSLKILWLMKEAYDDGDGSGDWSLPGLYTNDYERFFREIIKGTSGRTWQPVVYASYGILNEFSLWEEMPFIRNEPDMVRILSKVAWVNIQKLPSTTGNRTIIDNIYTAYKKYKWLIHRQIDLLDPDVIICGNTYQILKSEYSVYPETKLDIVEYFKIGKRLIINAYHPSQFIISRQRYVDNIVECVREWKNSKELEKV